MNMLTEYPVSTTVCLPYQEFSNCFWRRLIHQIPGKFQIECLQKRECLICPVSLWFLKLPCESCFVLSKDCCYLGYSLFVCFKPTQSVIHGLLVITPTEQCWPKVQKSFQPFSKMGSSSRLWCWTWLYRSCMLGLNSPACSKWLVMLKNAKQTEKFYNVDPFRMSLNP